MPNTIIGMNLLQSHDNNDNFDQNIDMFQEDKEG